MATEDGMDPTFRQKIDAMIAASNGRLHINSGYRSNDLQAQLYAAAVAKYGQANVGKWVAPPGHSNHNRGLAVDLGGDLDLAHQLAPQFGLEFPMSWEPWHIEPVGLREHSTTKPGAYTEGPVGSVNPTHDPLLNTSPEVNLARLSNVLSGDWATKAASGGLGHDVASGGFTESAGGASTTGTPTSGGGGGAAPMGNVPLEQGAQGGDKRLPGHSIQDWSKDVLTGLGAPVTQENMDTLITWANRESGGYNPNVAGGRYNPLNTTEGAVGYAGEGGSQGNIKDFASYDQGVAAVIHNLTKTKDAGYEGILNALHANDPQATFGAINASKFGTHF